MSETEEIDYLYSLVTGMTKRTIERALTWARKYEQKRKSEYKSHQIAVLVFLYESAEPNFSWKIGEELCKMVSRDINSTVLWIRDNFTFEKTAIYNAFKTWMECRTSLGDDYVYSLNKTYGIMQEAAYNSDNDILEWLLSRSVHVDFRDASRNTALHIAAKEGHLETVNFLLKRGASRFVLNSELRRPFDLAFASEHFRVCNSLCGGDIKSFISESKFLDVVLDGNLFKLEYLLSKYWSSIWDALLIAVKKGYLHVVEKLLSHCPPYCSTSEFNTNLLTAAFNKGDRSIIEKLLAAGFQMEDSLITQLRIQKKDELLNFFLPKISIDTVD